MRPLLRGRKGQITDRIGEEQREQLAAMTAEAVRRIIAPAIIVFRRICRAVRAYRAAAGALTIITVLKKEMDGRTINSESRQALKRLLPKHR